MIILQDKAALYSFYRWKKHKSLLFRKHVKTECPLRHTVPAAYLYTFQFSFENLFLCIFEAQHFPSFVSKVHIYVNLTPKHRTKLDLRSVTDHLQKGWLDHLAQLHTGVSQSQRQNSAVQRII